MTARNLRPRWVAFAIVGVCLLLAVPTQWSLSGTTTAGLPVAPSHSAKLAPAARPAFTCPVPPLGYTSVSGFFPPTPNQNGQTCPGPIAVDMIHGSFTSNVPGSAERWKEAIYLPQNGTPGQPFEYNDVYLGMVVAGDGSSLFRQSYLEVVFTPVSSGANTTVTWSVSAAVWAMHNDTAGGNCTDSMALIWNWSVWCVQNMLQSGNGLLGPSGVRGGTWYNVTFDGAVAKTGGMWVWANDSTNKSGNFSFQLNATTTGGVAYEPFFNNSCNDLCFLNWSYPIGLGIGWDVCPEGDGPFSACDTYNQTVWDGANPVEFGPPEFWVNASAGYGGDYQYFAPMSASGECSTSASTPVASCGNYNSFGGTGFYPFFSWNGTLLNFGDEFPWTVNDLGGEYTEYDQTSATQHDIVPLFLERVTNDSHGGYVLPNTALNVSTTASDLGTIRSVQLVYSLNSAPPVTVPMTLQSGTAERGTYNGSVPAGANGWINFTVLVTNNASMNDSARGTVYRGPLPHFAVTVVTQPQSCTTATVNGTLAHNGTILSLTPGSYPVSTASCYPYQFGKWLTSPGLKVATPTTIATNLTVTRPGSITANWTYVRPDVQITFATAPTTPCGTVVIDNQTYGQGLSSVASVPYGRPANVSFPSGCAGESFAGWTFVGNFTILGTVLIPGGNGTLTANFVSSTTGSTLSFQTDPAACGGILYRGSGYRNGEQLTVNATPYPVAPLPCAHYGFQQFITTNGAIVTGGNLTVTSAGSIDEVNYVLTEVTIETFPASCTVTFDGVVYGNGSVIVVANNSTHTVTQNSCAGYYPFSVTTTPGLTLYGDLLTVNDSGTVLGNWLLGTSSQFLEFQTDPGNCGTISFGGGTWSNTNYTNVPNNATGPIVAHPCANYGFVRWVPSPGLSVSNGIAYINASGSILAVFRPIAPVSIQTTPANCGTVTLNGVAYAGNSTAILTEDFPYPVTTLPCAHYSFVGWSDTVGATIVNGTLYLASQAILTANFAPTPYIVQVRIDPGTCGSLYVNGVSETNGTNVTLPYGTYPLRPAPCLGNLLSGYNVTGGVQVVGSAVTVGANGTLNVTYRPVPPAVSITVPSSSFAGDIVSLEATVAVLVPPYTYNYTWTFGDGSGTTTPANFTSHTYNSPGTYTVELVVHDPYNRTASANATIQVVAPSATQSLQIPASTAIILGVVIAAVVALLVLAYWRRRPPTASPAGSAAPYDESATTDAVYLPSGPDGTGGSSPPGDQP